MTTVKERHIPDLYAAELEEITPRNLRLAGLGDTDLVITDIDGVVRDYHSDTIPASKKAAIERLGMGGITVATFTNASKERIERLQQDDMLGDVMDKDMIRGSYDRPEIKKPRGDGLLQFAELGFEHALFLGDQIFSDVAAVNDVRHILEQIRAEGGPLMNDFEILSVLLPMYGKKDNFWVSVFRRAKEGEIKDELRIPRGKHMTFPGIHRVERATKLGRYTIPAL